ncbi:MAG: hypothetical protein K2M95_05555, partial [Clostridiales bacterium]|nr:hypothetical protein [Clostridiales bacterium]
MDDVSSVYITYNFLRIPKHRSCNLLAYAARFAIIINGNVFLEIDDCAILDFSIQLYKWFNAEGIDFVFVPMDDEAKVLEISSLNDNEYMLSSE